MITIYILHAGISHPSPYFYNFCKQLDKINDFNYIINPELPDKPPKGKGIIYFNRLKRFYNSEDKESSLLFLNKIDKLKKNGWKIVWTIHNFFPIDRDISEIDYFIVKEFIKKCDLVFTLTDYMKKSIFKNYNVDAINHGMGFNRLDNSFDKGIVKKENYNKFVFTFVGNIYKYKMLDSVIKTFDKLDNSLLIIAGKESANANVNIKQLIKDKKNIIYIDGFIGESDWETLSEMTDCFVNLYDLSLPAFKYGFFPSNFINIYYYGNRCISPKHEIIEEIIPNKQMIYYEFGDSKGLLEAMKRVMKQGKVNHKKNKKAKVKYNWGNTIDIFTRNCRKLFEVIK